MNDITALNLVEDFETKLFISTIEEIERLYLGKIPENRADFDFKSAYHQIFARVYKFANCLFNYAQADTDQSWAAVVEEMGH
ncbi:MAG: hypothetical protein LBE35_08815 [Clostridiales bacterium]|nr:hypothetical protein [Clostridiales bacterium]